HGVSDLVAEFVRASQDAAEAAERAKEAARQREVVAARRLKWLVGFLVVLLISAAALAVTALWNSDNARIQADNARIQADNAMTQANIALSRQLAIQVVPQLGSQLDLALLLGLEAYRISPTIQARSSLIGGMAYALPLIAILRGHSDQVGSIAF